MHVLGFSKRCLFNYTFYRFVILDNVVNRDQYYFSSRFLIILRLNYYFLRLLERQLNKNNFQKRIIPSGRLNISVSHYYIIVKVTQYNQEKRKETNHLDITILDHFAAK